MKASDILADVQRRLSDPSGKRWSTDELLDYLNYGIKEYARRTKSFRHIGRLVTGQEPYLFELDPRTVEVYFVEYDNKILKPTSWRELSERDDQFATRTGTPTHWYQDVSDITQLRVWPIPTDNDEDLATILPVGWGGYGVDNGSTMGDGIVASLVIDGTEQSILYTNPLGDPEAPDDLSPLSDDQLGELAFSQDAGGTTAIQVEKHPKGVTAMPASEHEYGVVRAIFTSKVRVGFSYVPDAIEDMDSELKLPDHLEEGLIHFVMVRAYERDGETRELQKAQYFRQMFEQVVLEATRRANDGFLARPRTVKGFWI